MSEILLNDFNNIYPLEKDLPQNKLNEQDIVRTLAVCYYQAKKHEEALTDTMFQHFPYCFVLNNRKLHDEKHYNLLNTFWHLLNIRMLLALYFVVHMK
jgi:hypothetical protein